MQEVTSNLTEQAEQEIAAAWHKYRKVERVGLEFGRVCFEWREKFGAKGKRVKDEGVRPILDKLNIPKSTAYYWIERYEESAGIREAKAESVHYSSESSEWYTPPEIIERVMASLGSVDTDPCSNSGLPNIPAETVYTEADDGLKHPWKGRVYMNPPYGDVIEDWVKKLVTDYALGICDEAIALVPARTDTQWFRKLREFPVCFVWGRLKFSNSENSAPFPSAIAYLGKRKDLFESIFGDLGDVRPAAINKTKPSS